MIRNAFVIVLTLIFAGCAQTMATMATEVTPAQIQDAKSQRYDVVEAALRYMFDGHTRSSKERTYYSAYVIENDEFAKRLLDAFKGYKPPVVAGIKLTTDRFEARDAQTRKRVKLWHVKILDIRNDRATVQVDWYSGGEAAAQYTLKLSRQKGKWSVESDEQDWIA